MTAHAEGAAGGVRCHEAQFVTWSFGGAPLRGLGRGFPEAGSGCDVDDESPGLVTGVQATRPAAGITPLLRARCLRLGCTCTLWEVGTRVALAGCPEGRGLMPWLSEDPLGRPLLVLRALNRERRLELARRVGALPLLGAGGGRNIDDLFHGCRTWLLLRIFEVFPHVQGVVWPSTLARLGFGQGASGIVSCGAFRPQAVVSLVPRPLVPRLGSGHDVLEGLDAASRSAEVARRFGLDRPGLGELMAARVAAEIGRAPVPLPRCLPPLPGSGDVPDRGEAPVATAPADVPQPVQATPAPSEAAVRGGETPGGGGGEQAEDELLRLARDCVRRAGTDARRRRALFDVLRGIELLLGGEEDAQGEAGTLPGRSAGDGRADSVGDVGQDGGGAPAAASSGKPWRRRAPVRLPKGSVRRRG